MMDVGITSTLTQKKELHLLNKFSTWCTEAFPQRCDSCLAVKSVEITSQGSMVVDA